MRRFSVSVMQVQGEANHGAGSAGTPFKQSTNFFSSSLNAHFFSCLESTTFVSCLEARPSVRTDNASNLTITSGA